MNSKSKIIVALDSNNFNKIKILLKKISDDIYGVKVGYQFFYNFNKKDYNLLKKNRLKIFLDLKLHDIPNTVNMGIKALLKLKPDMITLHISGGEKMLKAAKKVTKNIKLIGVSALTSLDKKDINQIYNRNNINKLITGMTKIALKANMDGIVCSPKEIKIVKKISKNKLIIITPGIRFLNKKIKNDDQKRSLGPKEAIKLGANYLVIGRPILQARNPLELINQINDQTK